MHIALLAIGVGIVVVGLALIGLGLADALGHTLVIAGTIAAIGSLVLSSLATVTRQLRRIAQALETRPMGRTAEAEEAPSAAAPSAAAPVRAPVVEPPVAPTYEPEPEVRIEPKVEPLPEPARATTPEPAPEVSKQPPDVPVEEPSPLAPKPEPDRSFDAVWSGTLDRPARETAPSAAVGVAVVEAVRPAPAVPPPAPEVAIFKSGVIDGMAYTLYTDGSIEAELPQGTVKFASIDELRAYLTARE